MNGCILAIVGSSVLSDEEWPEAVHAVDAAIDRHQPRLVISGGAPGVDTIAEQRADARGIPKQVLAPRVKRWAGPGGFKERNGHIAQGCECLERIYSPDSKTYGSGWTADEAERLGKHVERTPL